MNGPAQKFLPYASPLRLPSRIILRTLSVLFLAPVTLAKLWLLFRLARSINTFPPADPGTCFVQLAFAILLLLTTLSDLQLIWILTRRWKRQTRWIWPVPVFLSLPINALLPTCFGFSLSLQFEPLAHPNLLAQAANIMLTSGLASGALIIATCITADRDRRRSV